MTLPLKGIKILDFTTLLPGPYATQLLADMGAEVVRVVRVRERGCAHQQLMGLCAGVVRTMVAIAPLHNLERLRASNCTTSCNVEFAHSCAAQRLHNLPFFFCFCFSKILYSRSLGA